MSDKFLIEFAQTGAVDRDCWFFHLLLSVLENFSDFAQAYLIQLFAFKSTR